MDDVEKKMVSFRFVAYRQSNGTSFAKFKATSCQPIISTFAAATAVCNQQNQHIDEF